MIQTANTILGSAQPVEQAKQPSRTYCIDWQNGRIAGTVDGAASVAQSIDKIMQTERFAHLIYSWNYGMEWNTLIGRSGAVVESEVRRLLEEALLQDDRITGIQSCTVTSAGRRGRQISIVVNTIYGTITQEVIRDV